MWLKHQVYEVLVAAACASSLGPFDQGGLELEREPKPRQVAQFKGIIGINRGTQSLVTSWSAAGAVVVIALFATLVTREVRKGAVIFRMGTPGKLSVF